MKDLTREQLLLLNTDFGEEIEKQASAEVEDEMGKMAELEDVASSCMAYGSELAMQKIAEMEQNHQEKVAAEEEDKKGLEKKEDEDDEEEEKSEEEKNASAMGDFILEGYWNTMLEKGAEYYGDNSIYIEELCKEAKLGKVEKFIKGIKASGKKGYKATEKKVKKGYKASAKHLKKNKGAYIAGSAAGTTGLGAGYLAGKD